MAEKGSVESKETVWGRHTGVPDTVHTAPFWKHCARPETTGQGQWAAKCDESKLTVPAAERAWPATPTGCLSGQQLGQGRAAATPHAACGVGTVLKDRELVSAHTSFQLF